MNTNRDHSDKVADPSGRNWPVRRPDLLPAAPRAAGLSAVALATILGFLAGWVVGGNHGGIDLVGLATMLLALGTLAIAYRTGAQARLAREELATSQRPVLVPTVAPETSGPGIPTGPGGPDGRRIGQIVVPIENIGRGPALNIEVQLSGEQAGRPAAARRPALAASTSVAVAFAASRDRAVQSFDLRIVYDDLAGNTFETTARWAPVEGAEPCWADLSVTGPLSERPRSSRPAAIRSELGIGPERDAHGHVPANAGRRFIGRERADGPESAPALEPPPAELPESG